MATVLGMDIDHAPTETRSAAAHGSRSAILLPAVAGGAVSLSLGVYGRVHAPTGLAIIDTGPIALIEAKAWTATAVLLLVVLQVGSAAWMWGRVPGAAPAPTFLPTLHRWSGTVAFLLTLPVAYHCLWSLGFLATTPRVLAHSVLGCLVYGALTTKLLVLRAPRVHPRALPIVGGLLAASLTGVWLTSSLWFFTTA